MKRALGLFIISLFLTSAPMLLAQSDDHFEVGAFANYYRQSDPSSPAINFIGIGGRAGFNVRPSIQLEAEMAYDFERNYTTACSNCISSTFVTSKARVLHGFFGPKLQTGAGPFRAFLGAKVGFDNFNVTNQGAPTGFTSSVGLGNGATYFALYPSGGIEAFAGFVGIRLEAGDDIFFNNGGHNNLRVTIGPQFRF